MKAKDLEILTLVALELMKNSKLIISLISAVFLFGQNLYGQIKLPLQCMSYSRESGIILGLLEGEIIPVCIQLDTNSLSFYLTCLHNQSEGEDKEFNKADLSRTIVKQNFDTLANLDFAPYWVTSFNMKIDDKLFVLGTYTDTISLNKSEVIIFLRGKISQSKLNIINKSMPKARRRKQKNK
ncbi:MAG: hypothetical protein RL660_2246 [Bacteroidota bacterium]|jgi:hypothetical protein